MCGVILSKALAEGVVELRESRSETGKEEGERKRGKEGGNCFLCGDLFVKPSAKGEGQSIKEE